MIFVLKIGVELMAVDENVCGIQKFLKSFLQLLQTFSQYSRSMMCKPSKRGRHLFKSKRLEDPQAVNRKPTPLYSRQWTWV